MRERYLALFWGERSGLKPVADRIARQAEAGGLEPVWDDAGLKVLATPTLTTQRLAFGGGVLLGALFSQNPRVAEPLAVTPEWSLAVRQTGGRRLIRDAWGRYVLLAKTPDGEGLIVLRDPSGFLPAYSLTLEGLRVIASDVDDLFPPEAPAPAINWDFVVRYLAFPDLRSEQTGLLEVADLIPGVSYRIGERPCASSLWDPWAFSASDRRFTDSNAAAEQVYETVVCCTDRLTSAYPSVLLELSGGLDSSILAAALAEGRAEASAVTVVTPGADGDERRYARLAAARTGLALQERLITAKGVDLTAAPLGRRVRPGAFSLLQTSEAAFVAALREAGAEAFVSGTGGDNVFCALGTAAPAADALSAFGPGTALLTALNDLSRLYGCTIWTAARLALKTLYRRPSSWTWEASFLNPGRTPKAPLEHPWLQAPPDAWPGQRQHIALLLTSHSYLDGYRRIAAAPMLFPLLAQPVVELCLSIPSWMWIAGGRNRAVARDAFAGVLPPEILHRRSKGRLDSLAGDLFEQSREALRSLLLHGRLAEQGLLDTSAISACLDAPGSSRDNVLYRLLQCADVETWVRSWSGDGVR